MADIDCDGIAKDIIKDLKSMMQLFGSWPMENLSRKHKIVRCLWITIIIGAVMVTLAAFDSFDTVSLGLCSIIIGVNCVAKYAILFFHKSKFFKILKNLKDPLFESHDVRGNIFLGNRIRACKLLRTVYLYSSIITIAMIFVSTIPYMNSDRTLSGPLPMDMKSQPTVIYVSVGLTEVLLAAGLAWLGYSYDTLLFVFMEMAVAQLEILADRITHCTDPSFIQSIHARSDETYDLEVNKLLKKCVVHHVTIERYIKLIEETFRYAFFGQLIASLIIICLVEFNFVLFPTISAQSGKYLSVLVTVVIQLAIFCVPGNDIIHQSENVGLACYMSKWDDCGPSVRKSLVLIMQRSQRPYAVTAGHFVRLSHETLLTNLNSAFSYFTVLWQLYRNSQKC